MTSTFKLTCLATLLGTCTLLAFALRLSSAPAPEGDEHTETHVYATWDRFEVDRCVAAWLIKRFVDPDAEFDTPGARYTRVAGKSVSAVVLAEASIEGPAVQRIVQLVQATEVAFWMLQPGSQEANLRDALQALWMQASHPEARLQPIFAYLDELAGIE